MTPSEAPAATTDPLLLNSQHISCVPAKLSAKKTTVVIATLVMQITIDQEQKESS